MWNFYQFSPELLPSKPVAIILGQFYAVLISVLLLDKITFQLTDHLETLMVVLKNKANNAFSTCFKLMSLQKKTPDLFLTQKVC